jgi:hypothetical protein
MSAGALETEIAIVPVLNVLGNTEAVQVVVKGPESTAPQQYRADTFSNTMILFQNIVPTSSRVVMDRQLLLRYKVQVGFSVSGPAAYMESGGPTIIDPLSEAATRTAGALYPTDSYGQTVFRLRSLPLQSCSTNITLTINGSSTSIASSELAELWPYVTDESGTEKYLSSVPFYKSAAITGWNGNNKTRGKLSSVCPLRDPSMDWMARVVSVKVIGDTGTVTGAARPQTAAVPAPANPALFQPGAISAARSIVYEYTIEEPLIIPPMAFGDVFDTAGLTQVMNLTVQITLGNLQRMFVLDPNFLNPVTDSDPVNANVSVAPIATGIPTQASARSSSLLYYNVSMAGVSSAGVQCPVIGAIGETVNPQNAAAGVTAVAGLAATPAVQVSSDAPCLVIKYSRADAVTQNSFPPSVIYDSPQFTQYQTPLKYTSVNAWSVTVPTIRVGTVPQLIYLYVRANVQRRSQVWSAAATPLFGAQLNDAFLGINKVTIQQQSTVGLLSTFSVEDLYRMSVKNGYKGSMYQWRYVTGGPVIINITEDLCLGIRDAPGQNTFTSLDIQAYGDNAVLVAACRENRIWPPVIPENNLNLQEMCPETDYSVYVTLVTPGKCVVGTSSANWMTEGPSKETVFALLASDGTKMQTTDVENSQDSGTQGVGGGFLSKMFHHVRKHALKGLSHVAEAVRRNPQIIAHAVGHIANMAGARRSAEAEEEQAGAPEGGGMVAGGFRHKRARG